jgi:hypothetical protein
MSSAVIGNADKLSSAVMAARKKLQGSIAAVEAAVRCERVEEEQQRHRYSINMYIEALLSMNGGPRWSES